MLWSSLKSKTVAVLAAAMTFACGQVEGPEYPGEPLATLKGQLTSNGAVPGSGPIRLALAWYPHLGSEGQGAPKSILTEDVVYQGTFPLNYTFNVTRPPPDAAMADLSAVGGPKRAAMGLLLAYEDLNANGQLDTIPAAGQPIDKVLGVSVDMFGNDGHYVVYQSEPAVNGDALTDSLAQGFNLVHVQSANAETSEATVVPLATSITIPLSADPLLNIWVCEELFTPSGGGLSGNPVCGVTGPAENPAELQFNGGLDLDEHGASVWFQVQEKEEPVANATVTVNGQPLNHNGGGMYGAVGASGMLVKAGGTNTIDVSIPGKAPQQLTVQVPGEFAITAPTNGATLDSSQPFNATWTQPSGADDVHLQLMPAEFGRDTLAFEMLSGTTTSFSTSIPADFVGDATFFLSASAGSSTGVFGTVSRTVTVTFDPAP